jgi:septation ring formation regulator EzrA
MYKELVISLVILIIIFSGDYITQKYTDKTVNSTVENMNELKKMLILDDIENQEKINRSVEIYEDWLKHHEILAYYIEHDEIEKLETEFVACKSYIALEQYELADAELEKTIFILEHINDKYSFSLENIF